MASKLLRLASHQVKNEYEHFLRQAFEALEPQLRPPFPLTIPNPQEYLNLNRAILYGVLSEPHFAKFHIKYLHAIITDGYGFFVSLLVKIVNELYVRLVDSVKNQLIWVTGEMVYVLGIGFDGLLVCLLRQIVGGDFSDGNLWLCFELVKLFLCKWDCLLEEEPLVLSSALYTFLRLLADHCRLSSSNAKLDELKRLEIEFCIKMLREQFHLCMKIGRDLVRLLQDLIHVPEFRVVWKYLLLNPSELTTPGFSDISQVYRLRTSSRYFLLRVTPEMETQLRFLLTRVKFRNWKRYQVWFAKKFLFGPERGTLIIDIVRFICCGHHPSNEIIQSDVVPRWAVIGWLLKCCGKKYFEANVKLALFYDWLFFEESVDNVMNIEPAILLMVHSVPRYIDMTHTLLDFLFLLVDNYDVGRNDIIVRGVTSAFGVLVRKGVVRSLDVLTSSKDLSPFLKERLETFLLGLKVGAPKELQSAHIFQYSASPLPLPSPTPSPEREPTRRGEGGLRTRCTDASVLFSEDLVTPCISLLISRESFTDSIESLVQNLGETIRSSNTKSLETLEAVLLSFLKLDSQRPGSDSISPEVLSSKIERETESSGYRLFAPLANLPDDCDDETGTPTALLLRTLIISQHERIQKMLLFWSENGFSVGARLLSYASRLAYEADMVKNAMIDDSIGEINDSRIPLLIFHVNGYSSFLNGRNGDSIEFIVSTSKKDKEFISKLVYSAYTAYRCFLISTRTVLQNGADISLSKLLLSDLISCSEWEKKRLKFLFGSTFFHLPDLSISEEDIIKLLVSRLHHADLIHMQLEIGLKKYSLFGEKTETISQLINKSLKWDSLEQHKFWGLARSELAVSNVELEKIVLEFFSSREVDKNADAIAVGGLVALCNCGAPTPELVAAIMLLPNNVFQDFAAAVMSRWVISSPSLLFDSLAKFSEKFDNKNEITINHSAVLWLLNHVNGSEIFRNFSVSIQGENKATQRS